MSQFIRGLGSVDLLGGMPRADFLMSLKHDAHVGLE